MRSRVDPVKRFIPAKLAHGRQRVVMGCRASWDRRCPPSDPLGWKGLSLTLYVFWWLDYGCSRETAFPGGVFDGSGRRARCLKTPSRSVSSENLGPSCVEKTYKVKRRVSSSLRIRTIRNSTVRPAIPPLIPEFLHPFSSASSAVRSAVFRIPSGLLDSSPCFLDSAF